MQIEVVLADDCAESRSGLPWRERRVCCARWSPARPAASAARPASRCSNRRARAGCGSRSPRRPRGPARRWTRWLPSWRRAARRPSRLHADLADAVRVHARLAEDAVQRCGGLDVLVSNAGIARGAPLATLEVADWDRVFAVDVRATWLLARAARAALAREPRRDRRRGFRLGAAIRFRGSAPTRRPRRRWSCCAGSSRRSGPPTASASTRCLPGLIRTPLTEPIYRDAETAAAAAGSDSARTHRDGGGCRARDRPPRGARTASYVTGIDLRLDGGLGDRVLATIPGMPRSAEHPDRAAATRPAPERTFAMPIVSARPPDAVRTDPARTGRGRGRVRLHPRRTAAPSGGAARRAPASDARRLADAAGNARADAGHRRGGVRLRRVPAEARRRPRGVRAGARIRRGAGRTGRRWSTATSRIRAVLADLLHGLCELGRRYGIRMNLEPTPWTGIPTLGAAIGVVEACGHPDARVMIDTIHVDRSGRNARRSRRGAARADRLRPGLRCRRVRVRPISKR